MEATCFCARARSWRDRACGDHNRGRGWDLAQVWRYASHAFAPSCASSHSITGFCGHELPAAGEVDVYIISEDKWITVQPTADPAHGVPGPRSVHGFARYQSPLPELANAVAVLYHGERETSKLGHAGAGDFWDDAWVLSKEPGEDVMAGWTWQKLDVVGDDHLPEGRGWFPPVSWVDDHGDAKVVMFGGLLSSNSRSDELWELEIS